MSCVFALPHAPYVNILYCDTGLNHVVALINAILEDRMQAETDMGLCIGLAFLCISANTMGMCQG